MSYRHLTLTERIKIEAYLELGLNLNQISEKLGIHKSTLSREKKCCEGAYSAEAAQTHYDQLAQSKRRNSTCHPELKLKTV